MGGWGKAHGCWVASSPALKGCCDFMRPVSTHGLSRLAVPILYPVMSDTSVMLRSDGVITYPVAEFAVGFWSDFVCT